jgi:hypothetical protein
MPPRQPAPIEPTPAVRELRVFACDPSLSGALETWEVNETVLRVPWEGCASGCTAHVGAASRKLRPGPVGEYLEVVDLDPASGCAYRPVDLNHPHLLATRGLTPSDGNPQFHQQMVYAVASTTIQQFERALGRPSLWAPRLDFDNRPDSLRGDAKIEWEFVQRLRVHPHALREANAYYSPDKKALLFGYFPASPEPTGDHLPGGLVFTCLSHDIIAHETTHALLDGMHRRLIERTNPDTLAFHEAFADLVALFQHFTQADVLRHQIAQTRGDLRRQNLLGELAQQFGRATGGRAALRSALGEPDPDTGEWRPHLREPRKLASTWEPHARGSILVAAVFDAFLSIYQVRVADLLRLATGGTGILPEGEIHPDLVQRLAGEAARAAQHMLTMCIRALDYIPPVDLTFGEYLRALITADREVVPDDERGYRVALIEAFRRRGIFPRRVRTLSEDALEWAPCSLADSALIGLRDAQQAKGFEAFQTQPLTRREIYVRAQKRGAALNAWLRTAPPEAYPLLGLRKGLKSEVHAIRLARRAGPHGRISTNVVIMLTQRRPGYLDPQRQAEADRRGETDGDFWFRGGCTLIADPDTLRIRYCIRKSIDSESRLARQRAYMRGDHSGSSAITYFGERQREPFALLHRHHEEA